MALSRTAAAKQWLEADKALKAAEALRDEAAEVLKEHFHTSKVTTFRGVQYASSTYQAIDHGLVKQVLGKRLGEVQVSRTRETLSAAA